MESKWMAFALVASLISAPLRAAPAKEEELIQLRALFQEGLHDDGAIEKALAQAKQLSNQSPDDPVVIAYLGSSECIKAKSAWMPWTKLEHVDRGLAHLDKALGLVEHDGGASLPPWRAQETRLIAADTFLSLPGSFNTAERGQRLLDSLLAEPKLGQAPAELQASIYLCAAERAWRNRDSEAKRTWLDRARPLIGDDNRKARLRELEQRL